MSPRTATQLSILLLIDLLSAQSIANPIQNPIATEYDTTNAQYAVSIVISFKFQANIHKIMSHRIPDLLVNVTQWIINEQIDDNNIEYCTESINPINITFIENTNNTSSIALSTTLFLCQQHIQQSLTADFRSNIQTEITDVLSNDTLLITFNAIDLNITTIYISPLITTQFNDTLLYNWIGKEDHTVAMALLFGIAGGVLFILMIFTMVTQIKMYYRIQRMETKMNAVQPQMISKANNLLGLGFSKSSLDLNAKRFRHHRNMRAIAMDTNGSKRMVKHRSRSDLRLTKRSKSDFMMKGDMMIKDRSRTDLMLKDRSKTNLMIGDKSESDLRKNRSTTDLMRSKTDRHKTDRSKTGKSTSHLKISIPNLRRIRSV